MSDTRTEATGIDILDQAAIDDPQGYFESLRDEHPVAWEARHRSWLVTGYEPMQTALKDPRFSSDRIAPFIDRKLSGPDADPKIRAAFSTLKDWLVFNDAPRHRRLRRLVHAAFTPRAVAGMREKIDVLSDELLERLPHEGEIDLKARFADELPAILIAEMLGVPPEDRERFKEWSMDLSAIVSAGLDDPDRYQRAAVGMGQLAQYCFDLIEENKRSPSENLMSGLIQAQEADESLSDEEVVATCTLLLFAGHETTGNFISNSLIALLRRPDQLARLRDGQVDPTTAVEELLRFDGPGKAIVRVMAEDTEFFGEQLKEGERVFLVIAAANRDPSVFEDAHDLILDRDPNPHLSFGHGFHFCLGASLARMEGAVAIPKVLERYPDLRLADEELVWQPVFLARGTRTLPVELA